MLTDNVETDEIFDRATIEKTQRRLMQQTCLDLRDAISSKNFALKNGTGQPSKQATITQSGGAISKKRDNKREEKVETAVSKVGGKADNFQFRPHNQELKQFEQMSDNYKTMLNLGFLNQNIVQYNLGRHLNVPQLMSRPGRPVTIPVTYEDMMNVDSWDDSKLVFKKVNMQGFDMF